MSKIIIEDATGKTEMHIEGEMYSGMAVTDNPAALLWNEVEEFRGRPCKVVWAVMPIEDDLPKEKLKEQRFESFRDRVDRIGETLSVTGSAQQFKAVLSGDGVTRRVYECCWCDLPKIGDQITDQNGCPWRVFSVGHAISGIIGRFEVRA